MGAVHSEKSKAFMEALQGGGAVYWGQRGGKTVQWKAVQWGAIQWEAVQWWGGQESNREYESRLTP